MRGAVQHALNDLRVEQVCVPEPGPGEALVQVRVCGVCGTDASEFGNEIIVGGPPRILGHEFAGVVAALGPKVDSVDLQARVVCGAGISCARCPMCRSGRTNLCRSYTTIGLHRDGGLAGYVTAPVDTLYDASDSGLSFDTLGLAQPMAVAVHAVSRSGLRAGQDAVIVGAGGIGAFLTFAAASTGARVLVVDLDPARLEHAARLGAEATLRAGTAPISETVARLGFDAEVLFEVSGSVAGLESVLDAARPGATIVPVGVQHGKLAVPLGSWTLREYTIVGTIAHVCRDDLPEAVRLLGRRDDWSDIAPVVLPLDHLVDGALTPLLEGRSGQIKTLIDPWSDTPRPAVHGRSA